MTAPVQRCQPEATPLRQDMPLPWIVGPFGDIWVAADVEIIEGKWRETCPEPRIVVTTGGLDKDPKLAAQIVEAVNNYERERDEAASYHKFWIEEREKSATLQARVVELTKALKATREQLIKVRDASPEIRNHELETNRVIAQAWHTLNDTGVAMPLERSGGAT